MKWDETKSIAEIDACIGEIKQAAIDDGKDLNMKGCIFIETKDLRTTESFSQV
jgi:hypothetical protein